MSRACKDKAQGACCTKTCCASSFGATTQQLVRVSLSRCESRCVPCLVTGHVTPGLLPPASFLLPPYTPHVQCVVQYCTPYTLPAMYTAHTAPCSAVPCCCFYFPFPASRALVQPECATPPTRTIRIGCAGEVHWGPRGKTAGNLSASRATWRGYMLRSSSFACAVSRSVCVRGSVKAECTGCCCGASDMRRATRAVRLERECRVPPKEKKKKRNKKRGTRHAATLSAGVSTWRTTWQGRIARRAAHVHVHVRVQVQVLVQLQLQLHRSSIFDLRSSPHAPRVAKTAPSRRCSHPTGLP